MREIPVARSPLDLDALIPRPQSDGYPFFQDAANHRFIADSRFSWVNAWWMIEMSYLVYSETRRYAEECLEKAGFEHDCSGLDNEGSTQAMVVWNDRSVFVVFRGTQIDQLPDWLADFDWIPYASNGAHVHRGFYKVLHKGNLWNDIKKSLQREHVNKQIYFTGHSLGAALATLAASEYHDATRSSPVLYSFGSPRVGDSTFARVVRNMTAYRIVNHRDIVARVPPGFLFEHVGQPSHFSEGNELTDDNVRARIREELEELAAVVIPFFSLTTTLVARIDGLKKYIDWLKLNQFVPVADHASQIYATKIWNRMVM